MTTLLTQLTAVPVGASRSTLTEVLVRERLSRRGEDVPYVLVIRPPDVALDQTVIRRRVFRSSVVVSGAARLDYVLLRDGIVVAAGAGRATRSFSAKFTGSGPRYTDGESIAAPASSQSIANQRPAEGPPAQLQRSPGEEVLVSDTQRQGMAR
jgi:hypothetical protein